MLPWSVIATAGIPCRWASAKSSGSRAAPSSMEYSVWTCRWANDSGTAPILGRRTDRSGVSPLRPRPVGVSPGAGAGAVRGRPYGAAVTVLHLALAADWAAAQARGSYAVSTLGRTVAEVGFLHASEDLAQLRSVAERYYADVTAPLVVLTIDEARLGVPVVREVPPGETAAYPRVMGEVPVG